MKIMRGPMAEQWHEEGPKPPEWSLILSFYAVFLQRHEHRAFVANDS